jgi:hypothetical protein
VAIEGVACDEGTSVFGLITLFAPLTTAGQPRDKPTRDVAVHAELLGQEYCAGAGSSDVVALWMMLRLKVTDESASTVVLPRKPFVGPPAVAADAESGRRGNIEFEYSGDYHAATDRPKPRFDGDPDPDEFAILKPGKQFVAEIQASVIARRRNTAAVPGIVVEGSRHAIQVPVMWWASYYAL